MSLPRLIPILLVRQGALWKSLRFKEWTYVGDVSNSISIFSEKEVDELIILDTEASLQGRGPDFQFLARVLSQAFVPITYGGGVTNVMDARTLVRLGVDRISINSANLVQPSLAKNIASEIGSSSTCIALDVVHRDGKWCVWNQGSVYLDDNGNPVSLAHMLTVVNEAGVGQLLVQDVDRDGSNSGLNFELLEFVLSQSSIPLVYGGGLATMEDARRAWSKGVSGVAAGSKFVFMTGTKAVMLNYPDREYFNWI